MTAFWWTHWGHLATKPVQALPLYAGARLLHLAPWAAVALAIGLPLLYSAVRKQVLWPGCFQHLDVWKDEVADGWAMGCAVVPLAALTVMPWGWCLGLAVGMAGILWPVGLHRWALP